MLLLFAPVLSLLVLALCAVVGSRHPVSVPAPMGPVLRRLHRRLSRGWAVPGLAVISGFAFPPGWRLGNDEVPSEPPLPPVRVVFVVGPTFTSFTLGVLARPREDDEVPELGGAEWMLSPAAIGLMPALTVAWASWSACGDPAGLPVPEGWRLEPGVGDRASLLAGDGLVVRDVAYSIALPFAFEQARFWRRWRRFQRVGVASCVALVAVTLIVNLLVMPR